MTATPPIPGPPAIWFAHWLRAFAVIAVVGTHLGLAFWTSRVQYAGFAHAEPPPDTVAPPFWVEPIVTIPHIVGLPQLAVGFFFLISGFVIPMTLENRSIRRFVVVRIFRIWPVWLLSVAVIAGVFLAERAAHGTPVGVTAWTWFANAMLVPDLTSAPLLNQPGWTLLIEVKWYVVCAIAAATIGIHRALPIALFALTWAVPAALVWDHLPALTVDHQRIGHFATGVAWDAQHFCMILIGLCFYNRLRRGWSTATFLGAAGACFAAVTLTAWQVSGDEPVAADKYGAYVVAIVVFALGFTMRDRFPANRVVLAIAETSYSLYLLHFILGVALVSAFSTALDNGTLGTIAALLVVVTVSSLVYRHIERPGIDLGKRVRFGSREAAQ